MGSSNHLESEYAADAAFERLLLDSAKGDIVSQVAVRDAWAKFALTTGTMAAVVAPGLLPHGAWRAGVRWLVAGAIGGGTITAAWMHHQSAAKQEPAPVAVVTTPREQVVVRPEATIDHMVEAPMASSPMVNHSRPGPARVPRIAAPVERVELESVAPSVPPTAPPPAIAPPSTLAAEVLALDELRAAATAKDFARAVAGVDDYSRAFPRGQLAADADAIAIEALDARGDHDEAAKRAARFLLRYPKDPHAARMKLVVDR